MSRKPRWIQSGCVYHLISRFVDREWYIKKEQERRDYLELLGRALTASDWRCLAYAIMSNHIHLAMLAGADRLDLWLRRVHSPFADAMNRSYDRIGPMFVRGPKSLLVEEHGVGSVIAYIHNNPVRAKLVVAASESAWTSHRAYLGLMAVPRWLDVSEGLARAGFSDSLAFEQWVSEPGRDEFDRRHDRAITESVPGAKSDESHIAPSDLVAAAADVLGITAAQLRSRRRTQIEIKGREAVVLCGQRLGLKGVDIARALGVSQQAVSLISRRGIGADAIGIGQRVLQRFE